MQEEEHTEGAANERPRPASRVAKARRWTQAKRTRARGAEEEELCAAEAHTLQQVHSQELDVPKLLEALPVYLSVAQLARLLWTTAYWKIFMLELQQFPEISAPMLVLFESIRTGRQGDLCTDQAALMRLSSSTAALAREHSRKIVPFSVVAKSISWLMQRVPHRVWRGELKLRRLVSKGYLLPVLDEMFDCRPPPLFEVHNQVAFLYADQTYMMQGTSSKPDRVQFINAENLPVQIHRETVLNAVNIAVPLAVTPRLDAAALAEIQMDGVYRPPFNRVLEHLSEVRVRSTLTEFLVSTLALVSTAAAHKGSSVTLLSAEEITRALVGRPDVDPGGPSYFTVLPTVRNCSTQSYEHGFKILSLAGRTFGQVPILRAGGDGQLVLLYSYLKRRFPERCKHILIDSGDLHAFAHFIFALNELFWFCCMCCFATELEIGNVYEHMPNLENNNYSKVLHLFQPVTAAIVVYFTTVVQQPPPRLFYANPMAYKQQLNSAGGLVLFYCLLYLGSPSVYYQQSIRTGRGQNIPKVTAYALHVHRTVHKTQEQKISLIALISFYCIHPALHLFKVTMCSLSLLGHFGANMAYDRVVEWVNARQSERSSSFHSFAGALHFTTRLQPMLHVDAAYSAAALGRVGECDRGFDPRTVHQVQRLVDLFITKLGTDLTIPTPDNPFFHTGNAVPLATGSTMERRPWEYVWNVSRGASAGKNATPQSITAWVLDHLDHHFFKK